MLLQSAFTRISLPCAVVGAVLSSSVTVRVAGAQHVAGPGPSWLESVGGQELGAYVRLLALDTSAAPYLVGARSLAGDEVRRIVGRARAHPWSQRFAEPPGARDVRLVVLRPSLRIIGNTSFPFGFNDGPIWAGRGVTTAVQAGIVLAAGPLTVRLEPIAFRAENDAFRLYDRGGVGDRRFRDPIEPDQVDQPQRFGASAYQRVDLGNTEVRLDLLGVTAGISNAPQTWGPASTHPLILGPHAPGFLHGFVGTSRPLPLGFGRVHARVIAGRLEQSSYSPAPDSLGRRLAAGAVATFAPRGIFSGLELGVTRFFHRRWDADQLPFRALRIPLEGLLFKEGKYSVDDPSSPDFTPDNQLSSVFARWGFPRSGFEIYGEYARNDAAVDLREVIVEPDHASAYTLGAQRLFRRSPARWTVARAEVVNARATHIDRVRPQARFYQHGTLVQGHTSRGEVLGSAAVLGGSGATAAIDRYDPRGRTTVEYHRITRLTPVGEGAPTPRHVDLQHVLRAERTRFGGGSDLVLGAGVVYEMRRDFRRDAFNLNVSAGVRWGRR